jgi:hypothetical protein
MPRRAPTWERRSATTATTRNRRAHREMTAEAIVGPVCYRLRYSGADRVRVPIPADGNARAA